MSKERDERSGRYVEKATLDDVLETFDAVDGPPVVTTADVADETGISRDSARRKLETLGDRGRVEKRKSAGRVLYWPVADEQAPSERQERGVTPSGNTDDETDTRATTSTRTTRGRNAAVSLDAVDFPDSRDREDCLAAVDAARAYLREHGTATMQDLVTNVMPAHPVGYNVDDAREKLAAGERYRGGWWRLVVRPGLEALDDVEKPPRGGSDWEYVGGDDQDQDTDALDESGPYDPADEWE